MVPYLNEARARGYSTLVLNPNFNNDKGMNIKYNSNRFEHCKYVWKNSMKLCPAKSVYIASHSAGTTCCHELITTYGSLDRNF